MTTIDNDHDEFSAFQSVIYDFFGDDIYALEIGERANLYYELCKVLRVPTWQPIATAPTDGTMIDVWVKKGGRIANAQYWKGRWVVHRNGNVSCPGVRWELEDVTHWVPVPVSPDEVPE